MNGECPLNAARLDLWNITIDNYIENLLAGNNAISCVVDVSVGADHRNAKVSDAVRIRHRTGVRQYNKGNIGSRDEAGLFRK